jgi:hypothetical protein
MTRVKFDNLGSIGVVRDIPEQELPPEAFSDATNIRFTTKGVASFLGDRKVMASAITTPKWMVQVPPASNPFWVYGDESKLCVFDGTAHADVTRAAQPYSGSPEERWNSTNISGILVANNTIDIPQMWGSFTPNTPMIDLPNWPSTLRCKSVKAFKNFLIALNLRDGGLSHPYRVRTSHPASPGAVPPSWVVGNPAIDAREFDLGESDDVIVDGISVGDVFLVYRERSVYGMQFIGGPSKFRAWRILDVGMLWRDCVQATPKGMLVLGQDDVYLHSLQQGSEVSIIEDRMRKWLFSIISPSNFFNCFLVKNKPQSEVWICFPESGAVYASMALTWCWKNGNIGFRELDEVPFMASGTVASNDDDSGVWGE